MSLDNTLTLAEIAQLFHARLRNIEKFLSETTLGFNTDLREIVSTELDTSSLSAAQKTKLQNIVRNYVDSLPTK